MRRERGLALITVLLVLALVTLSAAAMLRSHQLMVSGTAQQIHAAQLLQLALTGEQRALATLGRQAPALLALVHTEQDWASAHGLALGEAHLTWRLEDLAGRFNLAALVGREGLDPVMLERWQRLCHALQVEAPALDALAGRTLLDSSQLLEVPGVTAAMFERLAPWVIVLPVEAGLNINTASRQVLGALEAVDPATAQRLLDERPEGGHQSVQRFLASPPLEGLGTRSHGLSVHSRWFRVHVRAQLGERRMYLYSDLEIEPKTRQVKVVRRVFSATGEQRTDG